MDDNPPLKAVESIGAPMTEAELHAYVDGRLGSARRAEVEAFLAARPDDRERVLDWQAQNLMLRAALGTVHDEPVPLRLTVRPPSPWPWRGLAAGLAIAAVSAGTAWSVRGALDAEAARIALATPPAQGVADEQRLSALAHRAAVAHVVYSPEVRRPVEVGADQEQALVTWLTKRLGTPVRAPALAAVGYELIGGRLLPGDAGPVAQFMYGSASGQRLTLYLSRDIAGQDTAFRFTKDGAVNVFFWREAGFGYAISAGADREELLRVSQEVYRQLKPS